MRIRRKRKPVQVKIIHQFHNYIQVWVKTKRVRKHGTSSFATEKIFFSKNDLKLKKLIKLTRNPFPFHERLTDGDILERNSIRYKVWYKQ